MMPDESTNFDYALMAIFDPISEGFYKAELKKKTSHEKKLNRLEQEKKS